MLTTVCRALVGVAQGHAARWLLGHVWRSWRAHHEQCRTEEEDTRLALALHQRMLVRMALAQCMAAGLQSHEQQLHRGLVEQVNASAHRLRRIRPYALRWLNTTRLRCQRRAELISAAGTAEFKHMKQSQDDSKHRGLSPTYSASYNSFASSVSLSHAPPRRTEQPHHCQQLRSTAPRFASPGCAPLPAGLRRSLYEGRFCDVSSAHQECLLASHALPSGACSAFQASTPRGPLQEANRNAYERPSRNQVNGIPDGLEGTAHPSIRKARQQVCATTGKWHVCVCVCLACKALYPSYWQPHAGKFAVQHAALRD